jgi:hypothetical protein
MNSFLINSMAPGLIYEKFGYQIIVKSYNGTDSRADACRFGTIIKSNLKTIDNHISELKNSSKILRLVEY